MTRAYWDEQAATFDDEPDHGLRDRAVRRAWSALLLEHLPPEPAKVVDLGCGTGTISVLLAEHGYEVHGIDLSDAMLDRARAKAADLGLTATFAQGDAAAPSLDPGTFDAVLSRHVLWALPDPAAGLERWVRLLAPGGRLVLVEGHWSTGTGLTAADTEALVREHRAHVDVHRLDDTVYWGREIDDERYLLVSTG